MTALVWGGKLCKTCRPDECKELGTAFNVHVVECPRCYGKGCNKCGGRGNFDILGCPQQQYVDGDMAALVRLARRMEKGLPPVAGGALDQESWFLSAAEFLSVEQARLDPFRD